MNLILNTASSVFVLTFLSLVSSGAYAQEAICEATRPPCDSNTDCSRAFEALKVSVRNTQSLLVLVRHTAKGSPTARECVDQANALTSVGFEQAKRLARAFEALGIAPEEVFASPACRTIETAERVFPRAEVVSERDLLSPSCHVAVPQRRARQGTVVYVTHSGCLDGLGLLDPVAEENFGVVGFFDYGSNRDLPELLGCMWPNNW